MKQCKQCGRVLNVDSFRKYKSRGKGIYNTTQGCYTICKQCESISNRVVTAINKGDQEVLDKLREHYRRLINKGLPPVTAAPRRLMGLTTDDNRKKCVDSLDDLLCDVQSESEVDKHCRLVRSRGYVSLDEAQQVHRQLEQQLKECDYYEELTELLDEWYFED